MMARAMASSNKTGISEKSGSCGMGSEVGITAMSLTCCTVVKPRRITAAEAITMPNNMEKLRSRVRFTSRMMATVSRPMAVVGTSI